MRDVNEPDICLQHDKFAKKIPPQQESDSDTIDCVLLLLLYDYHLLLLLLLNVPEHTVDETLNATPCLPGQRKEAHKKTRK